jgi:hypothetical protein
MIHSIHFSNFPPQRSSTASARSKPLRSSRRLRSARLDSTRLARADHSSCSPTHRPRAAAADTRRTRSSHRNEQHNTTTRDFTSRLRVSIAISPIARAGCRSDHHRRFADPISRSSVPRVKNAVRTLNRDLCTSTGDAQNTPAITDRPHSPTTVISTKWHHNTVVECGPYFLASIFAVPLARSLFCLRLRSSGTIHRPLLRFSVPLCAGLIPVAFAYDRGDATTGECGRGQICLPL